MIKKYIIDGNNLIWKNSHLKKLQKDSPQMSREKLVFRLSRFFRNKKFEVSLHFDGFPKEAIPSGRIKIFYSYNKTADENIRDEIDLTKNPKTVALVTSDQELRNYGRVNACTLIKSNEFWEMLNRNETTDEEEKIQQEIDDAEILRLFLEENNRRE